MWPILVLFAPTLSSTRALVRAGVLALLVLLSGLYAHVARAQEAPTREEAELDGGPLNVVAPATLDGSGWFDSDRDADLADANIVDADANDIADADVATEAPPAAQPEPPTPTDTVTPLDLTPGDLRVRDRVVATLRAARDGQGPQARARAATQRITALLAHINEVGHPEVRLEGDDAIIVIDATTILTVGVDDAESAGERDVEAYADVVANAIAEALAAEKTRSAVANTVFRLSLLVFSGLILFLLFSRLGALAARLRDRFTEGDQNVSGLSIGRLQVLSAGSVRVLISAGIAFGYRTVQVILVIGYVLFGFSLFERTRPWTEQLTGVMLAPFSSIATRVAASMPFVVLLAIGAFALSVLLRVTSLFFDSVARGETRVEWLPRELAKPTSLAARGAMVAVAVALLAPMITGDNEGVGAHAAYVVLAAIGLALLPSLASAAFGAPLVFSRRLRKNEHVEVGGYSGRVREVGLLELRLEDERGAEVRVPHLYAFFHPLRILGGAPTIEVDLVVASEADLTDVEQRLLTAARKLTARADVRLIALDADGAHFRVTSVNKATDRGTLTTALAAALKDANIALGKARGR